MESLQPLIRHYSRRKVNSLVQSKYIIERELNNLEDYIAFKLNLKKETNTVDDPLIQEILTVCNKSL
jgi:hypothetical protein